MTESVQSCFELSIHFPVFFDRLIHKKLPLRRLRSFYGVNILFSLKQILSLILKHSLCTAANKGRKLTEPPQFKRTISVERSICKNTVVI